VLVGLPMSTVIALRPQARVMMCLRRAGGLDVTWQVLLLLLLLLMMLRAAKPYSVTAAILSAVAVVACDRPDLEYSCRNRAIVPFDGSLVPAYKVRLFTDHLNSGPGR